MKTSNKLLIIFGLSLILLPILVVAFVSRVYMTTEKTAVTYTPDTFDRPVEGTTSITAPEQFKGVSIIGGSGKELAITLVKDKKYGVKISEQARSFINFKVDKEGILQVTINDNSQQNSEYYQPISIYAPDIQSLRILNAQKVTLSAGFDSLKLDAENTASVWINTSSSTRKLESNMNRVGEFGINDIIPRSASIHLINSQFISRTQHIGTMNIKTEGDSGIDIDGGEDASKVRITENLNITTLGKTNLKIANMEVKNISGSLSDSTNVQMPAKVLNQMYKKR